MSISKETEERRNNLRLVGERVAKKYFVACEICGNNTSSCSKRCNHCWQVEHHLEEYLRHRAGREHVNDILLRMYADEL